MSPKIKLKVLNRQVVTDAGNPMGPRFFMESPWPKSGWGPFSTEAEAMASRDEWQKYLNNQTKGQTI